jgi:hypothetical protein
VDRRNQTPAAPGGGEPVQRDPIRGPIGPTIIRAFRTLAVSRSAHDTLLVGALPDQSARYGVIHQLEAVGLQLLEIRRPNRGGAGTTGPDRMTLCEDDSSRPV